jgi:hypothetical protein
MRPLLDPTAGERARAIHLRAEVPQRVVDPTDRRFGLFPAGDPLFGLPRVFDPTDPQCGRSRLEAPIP